MRGLVEMSLNQTRTLRVFRRQALVFVPLSLSQRACVLLVIVLRLLILIDSPKAKDNG
jgi:hypothetical protein